MLLLLTFSLDASKSDLRLGNMFGATDRIPATCGAAETVTEQ